MKVLIFDPMKVILSGEPTIKEWLTKQAALKHQYARNDDAVQHSKEIENNIEKSVEKKLIGQPQRPVASQSSLSRPANPKRRLIGRDDAPHSLLSTLNGIIADGLKSLTAGSNDQPESPVFADEVVATTAVERLQVYGEAFQRFVDEFNKYKPFLTTIKSEYDSAIHTLYSLSKESYSFREEKANILKEHQLALENYEKSHEQTITTLTKERDDLRDQLNKRTQEYKDAIRKVDELSSANQTLLDSLAESKRTSSTLATALNRMEDDRRRMQGIEANRDEVEASLRLSEQKAVGEIDRLMTKIQEMELHQMTLINQEIVHEQQDVIHSMQSKYDQLEGVHKELIRRYITLKSLISGDEGMPFDQYVLIIILPYTDVMQVNDVARDLTKKQILDEWFVKVFIRQSFTSGL